MNLGLRGRVAIVTGAAGGIGGACADALATEGCQVVISDVDQQALRTVEEARPQAFSAMPADLAIADGPARIVEHAVQRFGRVDVLVTAGGVFGDARGGLFTDPAAVTHIDADAWNRTLDINLRGTFLAAQAAIPVMARRSWGRIVAVGSVSGQMGGFGAGADYAASKAALGGLVRSLALTAGPQGVTVNCVNPGMIETQMLRENHGSATTDVVVQRTPMRRLGTAGEVAAVIAMLASEHAGFITGSHVDINGGFYLA